MSSRRRPEGWKVGEDEALCRARLMIAGDSETGINQKETTMWAKIQEQFELNRLTDGIYRDAKSCSTRWKKINKECMTYGATFRRAELARSSGGNNTDVRAKMMGSPVLSRKGSGGGGGSSVDRSEEPFDSSRRELLSPPPVPETMGDSSSTVPSSWKLNINDFQLPQRASDDSRFFSFFRRPYAARKQGKIADYYKKQERLLEGFNEMETIHESGFTAASLTEVELEQLAKSERLAIFISNAANLVLFVAKVYASVESRSLAVIASTLDSFLDLLSGFILWFTSHSMRNPNQYRYPIGKKRMQPVGIIVFASVMATLGLQILLESVRQILAKSGPEMNHEKEKWMIGIMVSVTVVKFLLMVYCRRFKNEIVRAYAQDHFFDVITNSVGLVTAVLAVRYYWWIDPTGAILIALYTISTWTRTVIENVWSLIGRTAPPDFLTKLTYLIWNHHEQIKHIDTVRAYTLGSHYFVEVDIVLPEDMPLSQAHNIGETLQEKLEQLSDVERAFVHIDFEYTHRPEHKTKV